MKRYLQQKLIKFLVNHLYYALTEEDILQIKARGVIMYKGRTLNNEEKEKLVKDARQFKNSVIWKMLKDEVVYESQKRMFRKSESINDIYAGKLMLHSIDVLDKSIEKISNL